MDRVSYRQGAARSANSSILSQRCISAPPTSVFKLRMPIDNAPDCLQARIMRSPAAVELSNRSKGLCASVVRNVPMILQAGNLRIFVTTKPVDFRKGIEGKGFEWPGIQHGMLTMNRSQFEAMFEGFDWETVASPRHAPTCCGPSATSSVQSNISTRRIENFTSGYIADPHFMHEDAMSSCGRSFESAV